MPAKGPAGTPPAADGPDWGVVGAIVADIIAGVVVSMTTLCSTVISTPRIPPHLIDSDRTDTSSSGADPMGDCVGSNPLVELAASAAIASTQRHHRSK